MSKFMAGSSGDRVLDLERDVGIKRDLYGFPKVDYERHKNIANDLNNGESWRAKLKFAQGQPAILDESEFYYFELYRPEYKLEDIANYVGKKRQEQIHKICNSPFWIATSHDKALLELVLKGAGLPVANTIATLSKTARYGFGTQLHSIEDLSAFLNRIGTEVFAKPIDGIYGIGGCKVKQIDAENVLLNDHEVTSIQAFYNYATHISKSGYLFQELIEQHPEISVKFGQSVNTVRVLVFNRDRPSVQSALLKVAAPTSCTDNFWHKHSILAGVDMRTGKISSALQNLDNGFADVFRDDETKHELFGYCLPHWEKVLQLVLKASTLFPSIRTQSWDIAVTESGPLVVEFNWGGDLNLHQLVHKRGLFDDSYALHVATCQVEQTPF